MAIAVILILFGMFCFLTAAWRYRHAARRLEHPDLRMLPVWQVVIASVMLLGAALIALVGLLISQGIMFDFPGW